MDKYKLRGLLRECHEKGYLTEEFAIEASLKAHIYLAKRDTSYSSEIKEEAISHFYYKLVRKWHQIDPEKSPFSYINTMVYTSLLDVTKREGRWHDKKKCFTNIIKGKLNIQT